ncbi:MBL fold metallo-hydrolase [Echinicola marina]|uniref:MBL fold metallo-hydrolase n=1 Tax=Echinicola marina TaxID=2859768 RepID=UPI001CF6970F|nr:MBL fold metallo-hydrolase [Echinicola marina]UCS92379.1 MBL fold metallo-hydrolase [Echinicola marina]
MTIHPQFGASVRKTDLENFKNSPQWNGKKFQNLSTTTMNVSLKTLPKLLKENFTNTADRMPHQSLTVMGLDEKAFMADEESPKFVWYGHSVLLMRLKGKNILIDPMFGDNASPIAPFKTKRFSENTLSIIDTLPDIDAVFITHDHYDHIDYKSLLKLIPKVNNWFVALGVSRHLEKWGLDAAKIQEFDWWNEGEFEEVSFAFTPSRHFSGRGAFDRAKSLWGGWVFKTSDHSIYWSGDGGYDHHFTKVGDKYGPFDIMFVECGQYNEHWHQIHLYPEEAVKAVMDANANIAVPVHWGGFSLAPHHWKDPISRFEIEALEQKQAHFTPSLGQVFGFDDMNSPNPWWKNID